MRFICHTQKRSENILASDASQLTLLCIHCRNSFNLSLAIREKYGADYTKKYKIIKKTHIHRIAHAQV